MKRSLFICGLACGLVFLATPTSAQIFCNTDGVMDLPGPGPATVYPSEVAVSGVGPQLVEFLVQLGGVTHTWPDDLDIMLVGPQGQAMMLQSDAGGLTDLVDHSYALSDLAGAPLPDADPLTETLYQPANYLAGDVLDPPAPAVYADPQTAGTATMISVFGGTDANGTWQLYVSDDAGGDTGYVTSWCIDIVETVPVTLQSIEIE